MGTVVDIDGNVYGTVVIGTQEWTVENFRCTRLNDGTNVPIVTSDAIWTTTTEPAMCWFLNDEATYKLAYGGYYNHNAIKTGKLAPVGWHVPTEDEWTQLVNILGGDAEAGEKLKETGITYWNAPNIATNDSGFSARGNGHRFWFGGNYEYLKDEGDFWSSTIVDDWGAVYTARSIQLYNNWAGVFIFDQWNRDGQAVRLIRDAKLVDFSGTPITGNAPLTVDFTDLSTSATSWLWDFGDGSTSTDQNPTHTYNVAGVYTVSLTINGTDIETKTDYINVEMVADFEAYPTLTYMYTAIQFTDLTEGEPTNWEWNFGDGTPYSNEQHPKHTYTELGKYTISLRAWNSEKEDTEEKVEYITVNFLGIARKPNYIVVRSSLVTYDEAVPEYIPLGKIMYCRGSGNPVPQVTGGVRVSINGTVEEPEESGFRREVGPSITFG